MKRQVSQILGAGCSTEIKKVWLTKALKVRVGGVALELTDWMKSIIMNSDIKNKRLSRILTAFFLLLYLVPVSVKGNVEQATKWWKGHAHPGQWGEDSRWFNPNNWFIGAPGSGDIVDLNVGSGVEPVIDDGNVGKKKAVCRMLYLPYYLEGESPAHLWMTGGILEVSEDFIIGLTNQEDVGDPVPDIGILEMSGGTITIGGNLSVSGHGNQWGCSFGGDATINMTGGTIVCNSLRIPEGETPGTGVVNLDGGVIQAQNFVMNPNEPNGVMYITDGKLILEGNQVAHVNSYVVSNWLLPGDPNYSIVADYASSSDLTTVIAVDLRRAWNPNPQDGALRVHYNVILSWNAGTTASVNDGHDVYLGTDPASVKNATVDNPLGVYMGRHTLPAFDTAPLSLEKGVPYYWRIDEVNNETEPGTISKGYVWTFTIDDGKAYNPAPADNSTEVPIDTILNWLPGSFSDGAHRVYLGTSYEDVNSATSGYVTRRESNYSPDTLLAMETTYYWRVDEVNGVDLSKGHVWSFTTMADYLIDDFEAYDDQNPIEQVWVPSSYGSVSVEQNPDYVYHGGQSIYLGYTGSVDITRTLGASQDWEALGFKALRLYFYGASYNTGGPLSVILEDADGDTSAVSYPDSSAISSPEWVEWNIALQEFAVGKMDLSKVKKIRISLNGGGRGDINFDYIQAFMSRCLPGYGPDVDFTGDCFVDGKDLISLCNSWLLSGYDVLASENIPQPKVWYDFNETSWTDTTAYDKSGNGFNATYVQDPDDSGLWPTRWNEHGKIGGCLEFTGNFAMSVPSSAFNMFVRDLTIAFWVKGLIIQKGTWPTMFQASKPGEDYLMLAQWDEEGVLSNGMGSYPGNWVTWSKGTPKDYYDKWNHFAFVKKASTGEMTIYLNGIPVARTNEATDTLSFLRAFHIGGVFLYDSKHYIKESYLKALMDDFRIYDTALTNEQVLNLMGQSSVHVPLVPFLSPSDPVPDDKIDLRDFAKMAEYWLKIPLWP